MTGRTNRRLVLVSVFVAALLAVLGGRVVELMVLRGPALAKAAQDNRTRTVPQPAPRGLILDSSGRPLVANTAAAGVLIDRRRVAAQPDGGAAVLRKVASALGLTRAQLDQRLTLCGTPGAAPRPICDDGTAATPVAVLGTDPERLLVIGEHPAAYPGVTLTAATTRSYPQEDVSAGHLLGYLGTTSAEELQQHPELTAADVVGRGGLEQQYDAVLRGVSGEQRLLVDARGRVQDRQDVRPALAGSDLVTSIDAGLQAASEAALAETLARTGNPDARGAAVVLDVRTGRLLALASAPDYDPAAWVGGVTEAQYRRMSSHGALVDYALSGTAPPGSAFKPVTALAMQREGMPAHGQYNCPSSVTVGGRTFANHESEAYGRISLARALEVSCNTVFYRAADRLWRRGGGERQGAGVLDPIAQAATDVGLGRPTGVDLPGEAAGLVASPDTKHHIWTQRRDAWCAAAEQAYPELRRTDPAKARYFTALDRENCRTGHLWREGDAINAAIGQGLTAVTPLQIGVLYAAIANGGTLWRPTAARAVVGPDGRIVEDVAPQPTATLAGDRPMLRFLRTALTAVPRTGTAAAAFAGFPLDRLPVAGKTGSAQVDGENSTSWFASFAPADEPRYAVVVMVTEGGAGAEAAAPAVRWIYEAIFGVGRRAVFPAGGPPSGIPAIRAEAP